MSFPFFCKRLYTTLNYATHQNKTMNTDKAIANKILAGLAEMYATQYSVDEYEIRCRTASHAASEELQATLKKHASDTYQQARSLGVFAERPAHLVLDAIMHADTPTRPDKVGYYMSIPLYC